MRSILAKRLRPVWLCTALALITAGCVSAPIDLAGQNTLDAQTSSSQSQLRQAASALVTRIEDAQWSLQADEGDRNSGFLGRLIGGDEGGRNSGDRAVRTYLAELEAPSALVNDIQVLVFETRALSGSVNQVSSSPTELSLEGLDRDIAITERALGSVRGAATFFARVRDDADNETLSIEMVNAALSDLNAAKSALAESADGLAERRWALVTTQTG